MDEAPIPYDSMIRESSKGNSMYLAQALEQRLLLPKDMDVLRRMRQLDLFMSLKRDLMMVSTFSSVFQFISLFHSHIFFMCNPLVVFMQVSQQVFVVEECVRNTHNKFKAKSNFPREVEKVLGSVKEEKTQLAEKLKTSEHERLSVVARIKTAKAQAKD